MSGDKPVEIVWHDHWSSDIDGKHITLHPYVRYSVGYVHDEDKKGIILVRDRDSAGNGENRFLYIIKRDIVKRRALR